MTRFLLSSNPDNLAKALEIYTRTATVEAEYGARLVEGSILTLAHHGPRSANPAPCVAVVLVSDIEAVGLSHLDLDSLGGCASILGNKPEENGFWDLASFVDVNGPHKLALSGASEANLRRLYAYWAWSESRKVYSPRDGSVLDVTDKVLESITALEQILADNEEFLTAGDAFKAAEQALNASSFVEEVDGVIVRVGSGFTNHLYVTPAGKLCRAVVALRTDFHSCTVSFSDPIKGATCIEIVQTTWTDKDQEGKFLAGGHATIGGGPRNKFCGLDELRRLRDVTVAMIAGK